MNPRGKLLEAWQEVMLRPEWSVPVIGLHYRGTVGKVAEPMTKAITPDYEERYRAVKDNYIATALKVAEARLQRSRVPGAATNGIRRAICGASAERLLARQPLAGPGMVGLGPRAWA